MERIWVIKNRSISGITKDEQTITYDNWKDYVEAVENLTVYVEGSSNRKVKFETFITWVE